MLGACTLPSVSVNPAGVAASRVEGVDEEGGHLGSGDGVVGAVAEGAGLASGGYVAVGEFLGVGRPPLGGVHIGEPGGGGGGDLAAEDPDEPHRHDPPLDRVVGAEQAVPAFGVVEHAHLGEGVDGRLVGAARTHIGEPVGAAGR